MAFSARAGASISARFAFSTCRAMASNALASAIALASLTAASAWTFFVSPSWNAVASDFFNRATESAMMAFDLLSPSTASACRRAVSTFCSVSAVLTPIVCSFMNSETPTFLSRSFRATPNCPCLSISATSTLALSTASAAALRPRASINPDSSVIFVMLTFRSVKPTFVSSPSTCVCTLLVNFSLSLVISSMDITATTCRSWPMMISSA
mmetsp:Transcript_2980/g.5694  ORF Transcript_2980/g.5694 Transcript_2980/m.5694 type:complete len:210 (+) Transcript_2980:603-1232(+)